MNLAQKEIARGVVRERKRIALRVGERIEIKSGEFHVYSFGHGGVVLQAVPGTVVIDEKHIRPRRNAGRLPLVRRGRPRRFEQSK